MSRFSYVGAVALLLWVFIGVSAVELVVVHLLLPWETIRLVADVIGIWGLLWMFGLAASYSVHPHVVTPSGLRVRQGHGIDITVPWDAVATVGVRERSRDTSKALQVDRSEQAVVLNVVMGSRTDVDVRLRRPLLVPVRGGEESVTEIRLYADEPARAGRRGARAPGAGSSAQALVDVAPAPRLARSRSCASPGARSRGSARRVPLRSRSRSSRRGRRSGRAGGAPSGCRRAGTPRSPRACSGGTDAGAFLQVVAVLGPVDHARPARARPSLPLSSSRSSSDSSASSRLRTSRSTSSSTLPLSRASQHHLALGVQHLLAQPAVCLARRLVVARRPEPLPGGVGPAPGALLEPLDHRGVVTLAA